MYYILWLHQTCSRLKGWGAFVYLGRGYSAVMFACVKGKDPNIVLQFGYSCSGFYSLSTLYTSIPHMIIALELQSPTCHVSLEFT